MTTLFKFILSLFVVMLTIAPNAYGDTYEVDRSSCFNNYAQDKNFFRFVQACLKKMGNFEFGESTNSMITELTERAKKDPNDPALLQLSQKASQIYYSDQHCGSDVQLKHVNCNNMRKISLFHPTGYYHFACDSRAPGHKLCTQVSDDLIKKLSKECNSSTLGKNYCNTLITGFLSSEDCSSNQPFESCKKHIDSKIRSMTDMNDTCLRDNLSLQDCTGGSSQIAKADVDETTSPGDDLSGGGGEPGGDFNGEVTGNSDVDKLSELAGRVGNQVFGNLGQLNQYGYQGNNIQSPDVQGGTDVQIRGDSGSAQGIPGSDLQASMVTNPNTLDGLMEDTARLPGPKKPPGAGGNAPNAGGAPPLGGGGGAGFSGGGGGSAGGSKGKRRRRGGGYSRKSEISKKLGQHQYYGATGSPASSGANAPSKLSPAIRKKMDENRAKELANKGIGQVNQAFKSGLANNGQNPSDAFLSPMYFPGLQQGVEYIKSQKAYLDNQGDEF